MIKLKANKKKYNENKDELWMCSEIWGDSEERYSRNIWTKWFRKNCTGGVFRHFKAYFTWDRDIL